MDDPKLLRRVRLTSAHEPTGNTEHFNGDDPVPVPAELRIVQYSSDPGFYLFYCDESGSEMTDTYHDSMSEAMAQAEFEFNVQEAEWEVCENSEAK